MNNTDTALSLSLSLSLSLFASKVKRLTISTAISRNSQDYCRRARVVANESHLWHTHAFVWRKSLRPLKIPGLRRRQVRPIANKIIELYRHFLRICNTSSTGHRFRTKNNFVLSFYDFCYHYSPLYCW
jgi:hypothetical protein